MLVGFYTISLSDSCYAAIQGFMYSYSVDCFRLVVKIIGHKTKTKLKTND